MDGGEERSLGFQEGLGFLVILFDDHVEEETDKDREEDALQVLLVLI